MAERDLGAIARGIIDANVYMTLATAGADGRPWASPVFFAAAGYTDFYWISAPEVTHSRNLAQRPELGIVIFDSRALVYTGGDHALYMSATAGEVTGDDVERGLAVYPGGAERGARRLTPDELRPPGVYRLFRATVSQHSMLCPRESGTPCREHGRAFDHRTLVDPNRR